MSLGVWPRSSPGHPSRLYTPGSPGWLKPVPKVNTRFVDRHPNHIPPVEELEEIHAAWLEEACQGRCQPRAAEVLHAVVLLSQCQLHHAQGVPEGTRGTHMRLHAKQLPMKEDLPEMYSFRELGKLYFSS